MDDFSPTRRIAHGVLTVVVLALLAEVVISAVPSTLILSMAIDKKAPWWVTTAIAIGVVVAISVLGGRALQRVWRASNWAVPVSRFVSVWLVYNAAAFGLGMVVFQPATGFS